MPSHADQGYKLGATGLLTIKQVAERLGLSLATVRRLTRAGELTRIVIGGSIRFEPVDVEALIERGRHRAVRDSAALISGHGVQCDDPPGMAGRRELSVKRDRYAPV